VRGVLSPVPTISVVTPSFQKSAYIAEAIESVIGQEGGFAIEYFINDGGSSDGSADIIRRYAESVESGTWPVKCRGVKLFWRSHSDNGQTGAINEGLRRATGDVVGYLNADDAYSPGAFENVLAAFAADPQADFIYGDGDVIDESGALQWEWLSRPYNHAVMTSYHYLWNDFTNYILQQSTFWRRNVLGRIGYLDESFHYAMDVEYWVRAGAAGLRLQHLERKLAKFRLIPGTKSLSSATVFWEDNLEIYRRHRGAKSLAPFFAFFFYNRARELGATEAAVHESHRTDFARWTNLDEAERRVIKQQADRGFALACLLTAGDLLERGEPEAAGRLFRRGLDGGRLLALHPFALSYVSSKLLGERAAELSRKLYRQAIAIYRRNRFDYRYHRSRPAAGAS
jgi:glycosyltransferase involved in cell wall biosynthesis